MMLYFGIVHILCINFYVGTAAKQLAHMGDVGMSVRLLETIAVHTHDSH